MQLCVVHIEAGSNTQPHMAFWTVFIEPNDKSCQLTDGSSWFTPWGGLFCLVPDQGKPEISMN
jgi:hypothetical protein